MPKEPNWQKWRYMAKARLWQWIYLTMGIDPDSVKLEPNGTVTLGLSDEGMKVLHDRQAVAGSHFGRSSTVVYREPFIRFVTQTGWQIPQGFFRPPAEPEANPRAELSGDVPAPRRESGKAMRTLNKILLGLAVRRFKYDPTKAKSDVAASISQDLGRAGISVSDDAIRARLKAAVASLTKEERDAMAEAKEREGK